MRKIIASVLAGATVLSMASISAFAVASKSGELTVTATATMASIINDATKAAMTVNEIVTDSTIYIDLAKVGSFADPETTGATATSATLAALFTDENIFKNKTDKGDDDTKIIKKISVVEKNIDSTTAREHAIKIEFKEDMTDKEYKVNPSVTFTAKYNMNDSGVEVAATSATILSGTKYTVELGNFFVSNKVESNDRDWTAGTTGWVAKPIKNDENEITWEDQNDTIARLTFEGDSDVNKYYPKLSTKWDNADYQENFDGTDAFIRSFVGNPSISATSRPVLELYSPFVDEDGEQTVAPEDVVIYEIIDGELIDVTDKFTAGENDDGDTVFTIKTRTLGTYIISDGPATGLAEEAEEPTEPTTPTEETGKVNPGTGRW